MRVREGIIEDILQSLKERSQSLVVIDNRQVI